MRQYLNLDTGESEFFARELEFTKSQSYDILYPEYTAVQFIPVSSEAGAGAHTITYQQFDSVGIMDFISSYADDLPTSEVFGKEFTQPVKSIGGSYVYSLQEVRDAAMAGRSLNQRKANAARQTYEQKIDNIGWFGDDGFNVLGMLNQPNVPAAVAPIGATSSNILWSGKNPDEILFDMNKIVDDIIINTLKVERPDMLLLPVQQYTQISSTQNSLASDTTILNFFLANKPYMRVEMVNEMAAVDPLPSGDTGPKDVMYAYRNSADKLTYEIPAPYETLPAQEINLSFKVPTHARVGGVIFYYPLSANIMEGI